MLVQWWSFPVHDNATVSALPEKRKPLMRLSGPARLPESNRAPLGRHVSMQLLSLHGTADCQGAD